MGRGENNRSRRGCDPGAALMMLAVAVAMFLLSFGLYGCASTQVTYFTAPLLPGQGAMVKVGHLNPEKLFVFKDDQGHTTTVGACTPPNLQLPSLPGLPL